MFSSFSGSCTGASCTSSSQSFSGSTSTCSSKEAHIESETNPVLYQRVDSYIPRVCAIHDLCGYGKCSLGVAIPVLSAAGCDVCPVPTSLFSAHTKFPHFYMHDTTEMLTPYLDAWQQEGVALDAVYSGFLGSADQVFCIKRVYEEYPQALRIVDPVMGDAGKRYPTYTDELCEAMKSLVEGADLLTPNLTEAAILTNTEYQGQDISASHIARLMDKLLSLGAKNVVIKGVVRPNEDKSLIKNYVQSQNAALEELSSPLLPYMLHGTGDLYCSALLAAVMCGKSLLDATNFAGDFVVEAMKITRSQPDFELRGVSFEPVLGKICELLATQSA